MKLNKLYFFSFLLLLTLVFAGCSKKETDMNVLSDDNQFHYRNELLKFSINLPANFDHYITQRKDESDYSDLEFFVPSSDTVNYVQEVPGYAKPMVVRAFKKNAWQNWQNNQASSSDFSILVSDRDEVMPDKGDYVYVIKYWTNIPIDWQEKWNNDMKKKISDSFKVN